MSKYWCHLVMLWGCLGLAYARPDFAPPPVHVQTLTVHAKSVPETLYFIGSLSAEHGLVIKSEIGGRITHLAVQSGQHVTQGQTIAQINPEILQSQLDGARSALRQAQKHHKRATQLFATHMIARQDLDHAQDSLLQARAQSLALQAQLNQTKIVAPFSGQLGILHVQEGDVITAGAEIVPLADDRSLWVDFALPQSQVFLRQTVKNIDVVSQVSKQRVTAHWVADDGMLNPKTRQLHVRAHLNNPHHLFMPGAFVRVALHTHVDQTRIFIPQYAVSYTRKGPSVYRWVHHKAVPTPVVLGTRQQGMAEIKQGLKDQDIIITAGRHKLFPNAKIVVDNPSTRSGS